MNWMDGSAGETEDPVVAQALKNFKASVDAWSEVAMSRPRTVTTARHAGRLAVGWALGCVLAAGGLYAWHHQQESTLKAAAQKTAQQKLAIAAPATSGTPGGDEDLLATVDSDISREVPAAMEPLAQLVDENGTN